MNYSEESVAFLIVHLPSITSKKKANLIVTSVRSSNLTIYYQKNDLPISLVAILFAFFRVHSTGMKVIHV